MTVTALSGIATAAFTGTLVMTLFSAIVARVAHMDYIEPHLLNRFLAPRSQSSLIRQPFTGWIIHFVVGLIFLVVYRMLWSSGLISESLGNLMLLGFASGIIGAFGWRIVREFAPEIAELWDGEYYFQLVLAHVIFALVASKVYFAME